MDIKKRTHFNVMVPDNEPQHVQEHERGVGKVLKFMYGLHKRRDEDGRNATRTSRRRWVSSGVVLALASSCTSREADGPGSVRRRLQRKRKEEARLGPARDSCALRAVRLVLGAEDLIAFKVWSLGADTSSSAPCV